MARHLCWSALSIVLAGCAASTLAPLDSTHPASPQAAEAPASLPSSALVQPAGDLRREDVAPTDRKAAATVYTCPMHPEVRRSQPGRCPKCNMALVPADAAQAGGHAH
jgi:Heavy metal binding domain